MSKIAVLADKETAVYFKLSGIKNSYFVNNRAEAEKRIESLFANQEISLIMVTEQVFDWIQSRLTRMKREKEYPLVVSIPGKRGEKPKTDVLAELIKRTVGIEIKVG